MTLNVRRNATVALTGEALHSGLVLSGLAGLARVVRQLKRVDHALVAQRENGASLGNAAMPAVRVC